MRYPRGGPRHRRRRPRDLPTRPPPKQGPPIPLPSPAPPPPSLPSQTRPLCSPTSDPGGPHLHLPPPPSRQTDPPPGRTDCALLPAVEQNDRHCPKATPASKALGMIISATPTGSQMAGAPLHRHVFSIPPPPTNPQMPLSSRPPHCPHTKRPQTDFRTDCPAPTPSQDRLTLSSRHTYLWMD